jgi:hypothetical protein
MTNICLLQRYYVFLSRFNMQSSQVEKWDSSIHTFGTEWNILSSTRSMPTLATAVEYHVPSLKFGHRNRGGCQASFIKWLRLCLSYDMIFWPSQNQISVCDTMLFWPRTTLCVFWVSRFRKRSEKKNIRISKFMFMIAIILYTDPQENPTSPGRPNTMCDKES